MGLSGRRRGRVASQCAGHGHDSASCYLPVIPCVFAGGVWPHLDHDGVSLCRRSEAVHGGGEDRAHIAVEMCGVGLHLHSGALRDQCNHGDHHQWPCFSMWKNEPPLSRTNLREGARAVLWTALPHRRWWGTWDSAQYDRVVRGDCCHVRLSRVEGVPVSWPLLWRFADEDAFLGGERNNRLRVHHGAPTYESAGHWGGNPQPRSLSASFCWRPLVRISLQQLQKCGGDRVGARALQHESVGYPCVCSCRPSRRSARAFSTVDDVVEKHPGLG
mmetsp:Transcript_52325/g.139338  ORF Transcript_52325/g.139338 Transcript_52325/m.139338 type:complete len:273 (-) Transcript_52325:120-938(-)